MSSRSLGGPTPPPGFGAAPAQPFGVPHRCSPSAFRTLSKRFRRTSSSSSRPLKSATRGVWIAVAVGVVVALGVVCATLVPVL